MPVPYIYLDYRLLLQNINHYTAPVRAWQGLIREFFAKTMEISGKLLYNGRVYNWRS